MNVWNFLIAATSCRIKMQSKVFCSLAQRIFLILGSKVTKYLLKYNSLSILPWLVGWAASSWLCDVHALFLAHNLLSSSNLPPFKQGQVWTPLKSLTSLCCLVVSIAKSESYLKRDALQIPEIIWLHEIAKIMLILGCTSFLWCK
jgi:hypothetical protein